MSNDRIISTVFGKKCQHNKFTLDSQLNTIECGLCHKELNPMWVLTQFASKESRYVNEIDRLKAVAKKADAKNRCKCEKCGEMTRIQRG